MAIYLDPKADLVFKKIFAEHPHILMSFLNAVLPLPEDAPIVNIVYLPSEQIPEIPGFKRTIVDVKCTDSQKRVFIVEMQVNWSEAFKQRLLFSSSQALVRQVAKGESYKLIQPVYGLGLTSAIFAKGDPCWYHHYQLVKQGPGAEDIIKHLQLIFIELPKFPVQSTHEKKLRLLWLRFLREIGEETREVPEELLAVPEIAEAVNISKESAYSKEELLSYDEYWKAVSSERAMLEDALAKGEAIGLAKGEEIGLAKGEEIGLAKGEEIGLAKGEEIGLAKGEEIGLTKAALNMLNQGYSIEEVAKLTGLSPENIRALEKGC